MIKKIAIVGGGVEGKSNYNYFSTQPDTKISIHDQNELNQSDFGKATLVTGPHYLDNLDKYDLVVHSPGIRADRLGVPTGKITTSTKEFFDSCPAPIIGVTGTKGKGTTSTLIAKFLEASGKKVHLIGNIGLAALDELPSIKATDWVVYELSSFQLMNLTTSPHIAVHLMFEPDHLDVHTDMGEYASAKANIFRYQKPDDIAVYFAGSEAAVSAAELSKANIKIPFDRNGVFGDGSYVKDSTIQFGVSKVADVTDVVLVGAHMLDNVCAAVAATFSIVEDKTVYSRVLRTFTGLPHRLQQVAVKNGVSYIDDSISTIPGTAIAAIRAFDQPKLLILGGSDKGNEFDELAHFIASSNVKKVYLLGQMTDKIAQALDGVGFNTYKKCNDLDEIISLTQKDAKRGDVVLLSPACASFGMFGGYGERGDVFSNLVKKLP